MGWFSTFLRSSVGKKLIMGATGLFLVSFLLVHLSGNFLLFRQDNGEAFNTYSHFMATTPLIRILEVGLVAGFLLHMVQGLLLWKENRSARPVPYAANNPSANSTFFSRFMAQSGVVILVFLVIHLRSFFVPHRVFTADTTMYESVVAAFASPVYSGFYVAAMVLLGFHLNHGFSSAFQTFGLNGKKFTPLIKTLGLLFAVLVPLGFASMPVYFLLKSMSGGN